VHAARPQRTHGALEGPTTLPQRSHSALSNTMCKRQETAFILSMLKSNERCEFWCDRGFILEAPKQQHREFNSSFIIVLNQSH